MEMTRSSFITDKFKQIKNEYEAVKKRAGIFDASCIGKIEIKGKDTFSFIQNLVTSDISRLNNNQGIHTLMCYPYGAIMESIVIYKLEDNHYLLVINSGNIEKTFKWIINRKRYQNLSIINITGSLYQIAVHGPKAFEILQKLTETNLNNIQRFSFDANVPVAGKKCLISRMGCILEDGFELYTSWENGKNICSSILNEGKAEGIKFIGTETRDALRYEGNLPLFGDELEDITPLEAGFDDYIKFDKEDFIGKTALMKQSDKGITKKIVSLQLNDKKSILSPGAAIIANDKKVGTVNSWHFSPKKGANVGIAVLDLKYTSRGTKLFIKDTDALFEAKVIA